MAKSNAYQEILEMYPLVSYEEERARNGHVALLSEENTEVIEGLTYSRRRYRIADGRETDVYLMILRPDAAAQLATSVCPLRTIKRVKDHAIDFDRKVLFAMNAGFFHFFNNGDLTPYGIQVMHGVVMAEPGRDKVQYSTNWVGVLKDGTPVISDVDGYNDTYRGKLDYAVGGGLVLIKDGEIRLHNDPEIDPRTAVAIAADGTVILLNADGRATRSAGLTYADMIEIYTSLGFKIRDLLNLDGGGSTTVVLREANGEYAVKNNASGPPLPISYSKYGVKRPQPCGEEQARAVADCLLIIEK